MPVEVDTPVLGRKSFVAHLSSQVKSNQTKSQGKEQRAESATSNPTAATKQPRDGHPTPEYRAPTAGGAPHTHKHPNSLAPRTNNQQENIHTPPDNAQRTHPARRERRVLRRRATDVEAPQGSLPEHGVCYRQHAARADSHGRHGRVANRRVRDRAVRPLPREGDGAEGEWGIDHGVR